MKKVFTLVLACLMLISVFAGCSSGKKPGEDGRGVNIYVESAIPTLHPYLSGDEYAPCYVLNNVYETLIKLDVNNEAQPCLATEWSVSDDGMVYTFKIVEGAKFHNGEELKASDVAFSLNTAIATPAMSPYVSMMDHAEATGDYTVDLYLKSAYAALVSLLGNVYIVNEKFYTEHAEIYDIACGTGPYVLREGEVDLNTEVVLDRYEEYRLGPASIPTATLKIITDASTARIQLETGELDFLMVYSVSNYQPLAATGDYNTALVTAPHTAYIALNLQVAPLDIKEVRQALCYATDNESITTIAYEGLAVPARALVGENSFGVDFSGATDFSYNLDKAKEKLAEAGFPNGLDFDDYGVELEYIPGSYHEKIANCLQDTWSQAGIHISLRASENVDCATGQHTMRTTGTDYKADMSYMSGKYASWGIGATNYAFYSNERVDELFRLAEAETDQEQRKAYYKELTEIIVDDCPYVPIQHKEIPYVWNKDLNAKVYPSNERPWYIYDWSWNS